MILLADDEPLAYEEKTRVVR